MAVPPVSGNNPAGGTGKTAPNAEVPSTRKAGESAETQQDPVDIRMTAAAVSRALQGSFDTTLSAQQPDEVAGLARDTSALLSASSFTLGLDTGRSY